MVTDSIESLAEHAGLLLPDETRRLAATGELRLNNLSASPQSVVCEGDVLAIKNGRYDALPAGPNRLQLVGRSTQANDIISGPVRVQCGFHKCMTMFSRKVYKRTSRFYGLTHGWRPGRETSFKHFYHRLDRFYDDSNHHGTCSVSGHAIDLNRFQDIRVVRFIRDPRDLLISGYHYHRRGGEHWCDLTDPINLDWMVVNGAVPDDLPKGASLSSYLTDVSLEQGLLAEMEFRRFHFESMMQWPTEDERVLVLRYEDILGNEAESFGRIFDFFGMPVSTKRAARFYANQFRMGKKVVKQGHVRDGKGQQWRQVFTPELNRKFNQTYGDVLERYGYSSS